ncbi:MAG: DUF3990 domain-containing protein [Muribaculaceae bacterium]|nr:DUF3990 domain-containing protein [Muribaculaceae bacterium]
MRVYHTSNDIIRMPDTKHSREKLDFGKGFYLTILKEQAIRYVQRFHSRGLTAYINEFELDDDTPGFKIMVFEEYDEAWLDFVTSCRRGIVPQGYDAISGGVANDRVYNTIDLYFEGLISKEEALGRLKFEQPNHQICILNEEMIKKHLHFINAEVFSYGSK